jgi:hypothetical protein
MTDYKHGSDQLETVGRASQKAVEAVTSGFKITDDHTADWQKLQLTNGKSIGNFTLRLNYTVTKNID